MTNAKSAKPTPMDKNSASQTIKDAIAKGLPGGSYVVEGDALVCKQHFKGDKQ